MNYSILELKNLMELAKSSASSAANKHLAEHGEQWCCGFAWVNIRGIKGNTKLGRAMKAAGYEQDYTRAYSIWNPSGLHVQCVQTLLVGAKAAAKVFTDAGFKAYAGSRMD